MHRIFRFAAIGALCAAPAVVQAQTKFGFLIGTSIASISDAKQALGTVGGALLDTKRRVGLDGGVFVTIPISDMISIQPELHYAQKGVTITGTALTGGTTAEDAIKIDYAEVPVLLRFDLGSSKMAFRPSLVAGASAAMRVSCSVTLTVATASNKTDCKDDDDFKKQDMSLVGGGGLSMNLAGRALSLQLRYTQSLQSVVKKDVDVNGAKPKNSALSILLGLSF